MWLTQNMKSDTLPQNPDKAIEWFQGNSMSNKHGVDVIILISHHFGANKYRNSKCVNSTKNWVVVLSISADYLLLASMQNWFPISCYSIMISKKV